MEGLPLLDVGAFPLGLHVGDAQGASDLFRLDTRPYPAEGGLLGESGGVQPKQGALDGGAVPLAMGHQVGLGDRLVGQAVPQQGCLSPQAPAGWSRCEEGVVHLGGSGVQDRSSSSHARRRDNDWCGPAHRTQQIVRVGLSR